LTYPGNDTKNFCATWRDTFVRKNGITALTSVVISALNGLFSIFFRLLASLMSFDTKNLQSSYQFYGLGISKYININILIIIAN
jgi:hypothetical protein